MCEQSKKKDLVKFFSLFLLSIFVVVLFSGVGNAQFANNSTGKLQYLMNSSNLMLQYLEYNKYPDFVIADFNTSEDTFTTDINGGVGTFNSTFFYEGNGSEQINYNLTVAGISGVRTPANKVINATNFTGLGMWVYGDSSNNTFWVQVGVNGSGVNYDLAYETRMRLPLNFTGWRYYYQDFGLTQNKTGGNIAVKKFYLNQIYLIRFNVDNSMSAGGYVQNVSTVFVDSLHLVDLDKGGIFRQTSNETTYSNGRYQEGMNTFAYLYKNGGTGFTNNITILNASLMMGDYLASYQLPCGGWQENDYQDTCTSANTGFTGLAFMKSLLLLKDEPQMQDNVTIYRLNNITTKTRIQLWNETAQLMANYTLGFSFPSNWVSNQYFGHLHATWLYMNYSGLTSIYNSSINSQLAILNNSWQLNRFGFLPEENTTSSIGFDGGYYGVGKVISGYFYQEYSHPTLLEIIIKEDSSLINIVNKGGWEINNGSRGNDDYKGVYDSPYGLIVNNLGLFYGTQMNYLSNQINNIWGTSSNSNTLAITSATARGVTWSIANYLQDFTVSSNGFRFPQNYSTYSYDLFNQTSWTRRNITAKGTIESINQKEFPKILFAHDSNNSWWIHNDSISSNSSNWIYLDNNGNFTLAIIPSGYIEEGQNSAFTTNNGTRIVNTTKLSISGSSTSKTITSSLTQSITATVIVNVDNCLFNARYEGQPIENNNCNGNTATFILTDIPAGESTLLLSSVDINCSANVSAGSTIILVFTALAIMGIALFLVVKRDELTIQILLVAFISIMVGIALFIQIAQNLGGACA